MPINNAYADNDTITVQDTENIPQAPSPISSGWTSLMPMILIFVVFYFLLIRPQEKRRRNQETLISGVKKGEEVVTNAGIFGTVTKINDSDNTVFIEIAKDVEVKIQKNAIADIVSRKKTEAKKENKTVKANKVANNKKKAVSKSKKA